MQILLIIIIIITGILSGFLLRNRKKIIQPVDSLINYLIYLLLFSLGISVGSNDKILNNLDIIGLKALILTTGAVMGSVLMAWFIFNIFFRENEK